MIQLKTRDVDFLAWVAEKGSPKQRELAIDRLESLIHLDSLENDHVSVKLDSGDDPAEQARLRMLERHRLAWKTPSVAPARVHLDAESDDPAERARLAMIERNRTAWKK